MTVGVEYDSQDLVHQVLGDCDLAVLVCRNMNLMMFDVLLDHEVGVWLGDRLRNESPMDVSS